MDHGNYGCGEILRKNLPEFRRRVVNIPQILSYCYSTKILSTEEIEEIKNNAAFPTNGAKWDKISEIFEKKDVKVWQLIEIFKKCENEHLLPALGIYPSGQCRPRMNQIVVQCKSQGNQNCNLQVRKNCSNQNQNRNKCNGQKQKIRQKRNCCQLFWLGDRLINNNFTGRERTLNEIYDRIQSSNFTVSTCQIYLCGMGGSGKTSIVLEFAYRFRWKFSHIFWFDSENRLKLIEQFRDFGEYINLPESSTTVDFEKFVKKLKRNWFEKEQNWLIIFDNVENSSEIRDLIPINGGTILVTSRNLTLWPEVNMIKISKFEESEELIGFLLGSYYSRQKSDFSELSEEIGYSPLAISNSCHYISGGNISIKNYLKLLKNSNCSKKLLQMKPTDEEKTVYKSCKISLDAVKNENLLAYEWLQICAFFNPDEIHEMYLKIFVQMKFPQIDEACLNMQIVEIRTTILKYGIVEFEAKNKNHFSIQRLFQKCIKIDIENAVEILPICSQIISSDIKLEVNSRSNSSNFFVINYSNCRILIKHLVEYGNILVEEVISKNSEIDSEFENLSVSLESDKDATLELIGNNEEILTIANEIYKMCKLTSWPVKSDPEFESNFFQYFHRKHRNSTESS